MDVEHKVRLHVEIVDLGRQVTVLADDIREQIFDGNGLDAYNSLKLLAALREELDRNVAELADLLRQDGKVVALPERPAGRRAGSGT